MIFFLPFLYRKVFLFVWIFSCSLIHQVAHSQLSDLSSLTFQDGRTYTFNQTRNYVVIQKTQYIEQYNILNLLDVRVYHGDDEIGKQDLDFTISSIFPDGTPGCLMFQSDSDQACQNDFGPNDQAPLIILDVGTALFNRVKIYNRGGYLNRILGVHMQFWKKGNNEYQVSFADYSATALSTYTLPCPFYSVLENGTCVCENHYIGSAATNCALQIHRYAFFETLNSATFQDSANVSIYGGTKKNGFSSGSVSFVDNSALFSGNGFLGLPDGAFEKSPILTFELWITANGDNAGWNRLFQFKQEYQDPMVDNYNSFILNRVSHDLTENGYSLTAGELTVEAQFNTPSYTKIFVPTGVNFNSFNMAHIVVVIDPEESKSIKVYVDGSLRNTESWSTEIGYPSTGWNMLSLGGNTSPYNENLYGEIHEFSIWQGAMDAGIVSSRYTSTAQLLSEKAPTSSPSSSPSVIPTAVPTLLHVVKTNPEGEKFKCGPIPSSEQVSTDLNFYQCEKMST